MEEEMMEICAPIVENMAPIWKHGYPPTYMGTLTRMQIIQRLKMLKYISNNQRKEQYHILLTLLQQNLTKSWSKSSASNLEKLNGYFINHQQFTIEHVLFIPQFTFNLISLSKLTSKLKCTLKFDCDLKEENKIVTTRGLMPNTLFYDDIFPMIECVFCTNNMILFQYIPTHVDCDVYRFTRQKKLLVSTSTYNDKNTFYLIHMDI
ncbi:hypothetical protein CR513_45979, partial [Mucuna pruriens]